MTEQISKIKLDAKKIIAIASGKGGVGKTTVAVNFALALSKQGYSVGILDADIYGPNVPHMLNMGENKVVLKDKKIVPIEKYNIKVMSVEFINTANQALIWRGPLANKLIEQFLEDVLWTDLDYLIIDLPPGTGDVPLSIVQKVELDGAIIVSIPSVASIADVKKMIDMLNKTEVKILGLVENMKYLSCSECKNKIELYPNEININNELNLSTLAELPFDPRLNSIRKDNQPYLLTEKPGLIKNEYAKMVEKVSALIHF